MIKYNINPQSNINIIDISNTLIIFALLSLYRKIPILLYKVIVLSS